MELEQVYWIAGIVVAVVAVIGLFWKRKAKPRKNIQKTAIFGKANTVNQSISEADQD